MNPDPRRTTRKDDPKPELRSGLPGTPEQRRRALRKAIKRNAETLRRLAR